MAFFPEFSCEGEQSDLAGAFDRSRYFALVFGARASLAAWANFAVISDKAF